MHAIQGSLEELLTEGATPLANVTFVVVDLETTGTNSEEGRITEVGAVKVRGGEVLGEFQTLVNPGQPIPPFVAVLTGITDGMVARAPREDEVIPSFLEFARGAVLVAHNAPFDIGFLKSAVARLGLTWPQHSVIDTLTLARKLVSRDEAPNHKLGTLAALFSAEVTPDHRALHDARATVDVLHALLGRVGSRGVTTVDELNVFCSKVSKVQQRKRHLADNLPSAPGVYMFKDEAGQVLYVGTSVDIRRRVRSYFTAAEQRARVRDMLNIAASVTPVVCQTVLEAQVRELRLIAEHAPPFNRRSRRPERAPWIKLTSETFPRLSVVREVRDDGAQYAGPFSSHRRAAEAIDGLHDSLPLRRCTQRIRAGGGLTACALAEMGRCGAPCNGSQSPEQYAQVADRARAVLTGDAGAVVATMRARMADLAAEERYEEAAVARDRARSLVRGVRRAQEIIGLARIPQIVAARRRPAGGWEFACIRFGHVSGTAVSPRGADPMPYIHAMKAAAAVRPEPDAGIGSALAEEIGIIARWLATPGTRLVEVEGEWVCPVRGAGAYVDMFSEGTHEPDEV